MPDSAPPSEACNWLKKEVATAAFVYMALATLAMFQMFLGRVYFPQQIFNNYYPWRYQVRGLESGWVDMGNKWLQDAAQFVGPQEVYISERLAAGEFPLWNPRLFCGHPVAANSQSELFYPVKVAISGLLDREVGQNVYLWLHLWLAGLAFFLYARLYVRAVPAFVGGLLWMLHGFMAVYLESKMGVMGVLIPASLVGVEMVVRRPTYRSASLLGIVGAFLMVTSHKQFTAYAYVLAGVTFLFRLYQCRRDGATVNRIKKAVWALFLACMLGAPLLLSYLELASHSSRLKVPLLGLFAQNRFFLENFITLFLPEALGSPVSNFYLTRQLSRIQTPMELTHHLGLVGMLLAVLGVNWRDPLSRYYSAVSAYLFLACWQPIVYAPIYYLLPGFAYFTPSRILMIASFGLCVLASLGMQALVTNTVSLRQIKAVRATYGILLLGASWWCWQVATYSPFFNRVLAQCQTTGVLTATVPNNVPVAGLAKHMVGLITDFYRPTNPALWLPFLCGAVFLLVASFFPRARKASSGVVVLMIFIELAFFLNRWNPTTPFGTTFSPLPAIDQLKGAYRSCGYHFLAPPNMMAAYVDTPDGYDSLRQGDYAQFFTVWQQRPNESYQVLASFSESPLFWKWCSLMGVGFVHVEPIHTVEVPSDWKVAYDHDLRIYKNPEQPLRAWLVTDWTTVESADACLRKMLEPDFDFRSSAVVEAKAPWGGAAGKPGSGGQAAITASSANSVTVQVDAKENSLLVLNDSFYPGWVCRVDGRSVPVVRADRVFRGVFLTEGKHSVEFSFRPRSIGIGLVLTLLGFIFTGLPFIRRVSKAVQHG